MRLSIVIPMFNAEKYVSRCLDSLINQDISKNIYEIIIINDGSTDNSLNICKEYQRNESNIKIISTKNLGQSSARNIGIEASQGEYIFFADSDDYIAINSLGTLIKHSSKHNLDIFCFKIIRANTSELIPYSNLNITKYSIKLLNGIKYITDFDNYYREGVWWYFIKKRYLTNLGLTFIEGRHLQDTIFNLELFINAKRVAFFPIDIYRYVIDNNNSVWTNRNPEHIRKVVDDFTFIIVKYNQLLKKTNNPKLTDHMGFYIARMIINMMKRLLISDLSFSEINDNLNLLKNENLYPLESPKNLIKKRYKKWFLTFIFRNKIRFFTTIIIHRIIRYPIKKLRLS